jgi:phage tail protein X
MATEYRTVQGDTFESIAWFQLGDSALMWDIIKANREHMETVVFDEGVVLTLPDVETASTSETSSSTPPWRR